MTDSSCDDFPYEIVRSPRRRTVGISVKSDGTVRVFVPALFPASRIHALVEGKADWIRKKRDRFLARQAELEPIRFADGETVPYLGGRLELRMQRAANGRCELDGELLRLFISSDPDNTGFRERCTEVLEAWYRQAAEEHFRLRSSYYAEVLDVAPKIVGIKAYRSRWGSCHRDGRIYFNWRLIMAPPFVIDYVVIHELCHMLHADHSSRFWLRVEQFCPDFRTARSWLKEHGHRLDV